MNVKAAWDQMERIRRQRWHQSVSPRETPGDLVQRLRDRAYSGLPDPLSEQAADEIERLRLAVCRLADQDATLSVCDGNVTVTMDATLTDAEREAVGRQAKWLVNQAKNKPDIHSADLLLQEAATLRGLLDRLG